MKFDYKKYDATGNDFVVIDNRDQNVDMKNVKLWSKVCDRRDGIGADGVIFLLNSNKADFKMVYLNADGSEVEMCGNGTRAICHFAHFHLKGFENKKLKFETLNAMYTGEIVSKKLVRVCMSELSDWGNILIEDLFESKFSDYLCTGVPHCIFEIENELHELDLLKEGARVRYDKRFLNGVNVNFVKVIKKKLVSMRTYERGVEGETKSCGTGTVAAALALAKHYNWDDFVNFNAPGGELKILFNKDFTEVWLEGEVHSPFAGTYEYT